MIRTPLSLVALFAFAAISWFATAADRPKSPPGRTDELLDLTPAQRMNRLAKVLDKQKDLIQPDRGAVVANITERGNLQAVNTSDIICKVRALQKNAGISAIIKWVIDDGTFVKKGDRLIEFDDSAHAELLRQQKSLAAKAKAEHKKAADSLERIKKETGIDIKVAQIDVRLADLAFRLYKGTDQVQKDILALQVDRAALLVEKLRLRAAVKEEEAAEIVVSKKAIDEQERDRQRAIEEEIARCAMTAPRDGYVVYYFPEQVRGKGGQAIVAQGEPVREGQKLMVIADLSKMAVQTRIHESMIAKVRVGQKAAIRVDAFPGKAYTGAVAEIATVPDDFPPGSPDYVKVYRVLVTIDGENKTLKPGMSAETSISVGEAANALRLPASAVLGTAKQRYCYVVVKNELHVRKVTIGLSDGKLVEIRTGLSEIDLVLRNPMAIAARTGDK
ncbi:MAG: efflux RND transporter periplasmic adaptor subunit [Planctomycetes bacterium]|nr:efflux RND transporter periplasmic adaptor subunit [Planctomycetota bacterium]